MSTESYKNFLRRLEQTGREYYDGFAAADFAGLTEAESGEVRRILLSRAGGGDGVSLNALRFVLSAQEVAALADEMLAARGSAELFDAELAIALDDIREDDASWAQVMRVLESGDEFARQLIINKLSTVEVPTPRSQQLTQLLHARIPEEKNHVVLLGEVVVLLKLLGFKPASAEMAASAKRLQSVDRRERVKELQRLGAPRT